MKDLNILFELDKDKLCDAYQHFKRTGIDFLFMWTQFQYDQSLMLYRYSKRFRNKEDYVFFQLWLACEQDLEEWYTLKYSKEEFRVSFEKSWKEYVASCSIKRLESSFARKYILDEIDRKYRQIKSYEFNETSQQKDLNKRGSVITGIYHNYRFVPHEEFIFRLDNIINAVEVKRNEDYGLALEIFAETDNEYIYFS